MKVQISQRYVYHKVGVIEIDVNIDDYQNYVAENGVYHSIGDYLLDNEELWLEKIDEATDDSQVYFGFGLGYSSHKDYNVNFNKEGSESEIKYNCNHLQINGNL